MGTSWRITVWDTMSIQAFEGLAEEARSMANSFEQTYSRFRPDSLVRVLSTKTGRQEVPRDLIKILRINETLHTLSNNKFTPLTGFTLTDMGYDEHYSLKKKTNIRPVPLLEETLAIIDDEHIDLKLPVLLDFGAVGKGYCVDLIAALLRSKSLQRFLVDGSGDIVYEGNGQPIRAGLEDPSDPTKAIGVLTMTKGAFCASGGNKRQWDGHHHHIIDPTTLTSPPNVAATWVLAETCALADGLATCLFLADPEQFREKVACQYCMMNREHRVTMSPGFTAELFTQS
jgi:thiamine biosynthesis lipoprotein